MDGITFIYNKKDTELLNKIIKWWEELTKLKLEYANYKQMIIRDVNNYISITTSGKVKTKGIFEDYDDIIKAGAYHKDTSAMIIPKALKAYSGEGDQTPGDWCKFCKAKAICRGLSEQNMKLAEFEFRDPHLLSDKEVAVIYSQLSILQDWAGVVSSYVLEEAIKGKQWPGYKLVEGKSNRKWLDENKVVEVLQEDYDQDEFMVSKLAGITAIEKLVGKANFGPKLNQFIVKPPGAPTLVEESDKRPAMGVEQAKLDFKD